MADDIRLEKNEGLLYTNYFGLKQKYVEKLSNHYGKQLIVDNTQAFFAKPIDGIDTFYTCRKFFGVPDGAYLYTDQLLDDELEQDESYERMSFLLKRIDLGAEAGYADFREQSHLLIGQPIKRMSKLTERLMQSIDYQLAAKRRRENFELLHQALEGSNQYHIHLSADAVPMVYPYLSDHKELRDYLIGNKLFVACYWPNVLEKVTKDSVEFKMAKALLPLPIDQRYSFETIKTQIRMIKDYVKR